MTENKLQELRTAIGATQSQMANRMGVPLRTYEDLEGGRSTIRPVHMRAAEMAAIIFSQDRGVEHSLPDHLKRLTRYNETPLS